MNTCSDRQSRLGWRVALAASLCLFLQAAASPKPRIGMTFDLRSKQETRVTELWVESTQVIGRGGIFVYPKRPGYQGLVHPLDPDGKLPELRAIWKYVAMDAVDEAGVQTLTDKQLPWRETQAVVALGDVLDAGMLEQLRNDTARRWLKLVLIFDRDRLEVRGRVE